MLKGNGCFEKDRGRHCKDRKLLLFDIFIQPNAAPPSTQILPRHYGLLLDSCTDLFAPFEVLLSLSQIHRGSMRFIEFFGDSFQIPNMTLD